MRHPPHFILDGEPVSDTIEETPINLGNMITSDPSKEVEEKRLVKN